MGQISKIHNTFDGNKGYREGPGDAREGWDAKVTSEE